MTLTSGDGSPSDSLTDEIVDLTALVRRVVGRRVRDPSAVDDIVQETMARLLAARHRLNGRALSPYAIVTAQNLITSQWQRAETGKRNEHRLVDLRDPPAPDDLLIAQQEAEALRSGLDRLEPREREVLVAHVLGERNTSSLAEDLDSTPGAVAARLSRSRAKLRVEYLLARDGVPPTRQCRPVLLALSAGDRRRQDDLDAGQHLLECDFCASLSKPLFDRLSRGAADQVRIPVEADADVVVARQRVRDVSLGAGFSETEATVIATAVSEITRNIVRFARRGEVTITVISDRDAVGVTVVARDAGPGIADLELALTEGHSTCGGLGLGIPGARRLMDEFEITSEVGRGTTVTMTKWHRA